MSAGMKISSDEEHWLGIKSPSLCPGFATYSMILSKSPKLISKTGRVSVYFLDCVRVKWLTNLEWYLAHRKLAVAQDHTATAHKQVNTELLWLHLGVGQWDPEPRPLAPTLS